ncbi:ribonuclease H-like domain-containing protein [Tanacetum coccineum]
MKVGLSDARRLLQFKLKRTKHASCTGYRQEEGVDYDEVFGTVCQIEAISLFLAFASFMGFIVYQHGCQECFLIGNITEGSVMSNSSRFEDPDSPNKSTELSRHFMAWHQAHRAWSMIGYLHVTNCFKTRHKFAVCLCARFQVTPKVLHLMLATSGDGNILEEDWSLGNASSHSQTNQLWLYPTEAEYVAALQVVVLRDIFQMVHLFLCIIGSSNCFEQAVRGVDRPQDLYHPFPLPLRAASSARDAQGTPTQSAAHSQRTASVQGTASFHSTAVPHDSDAVQGTDTLQGTAAYQGTASIPKSPNDYTPTDASQTSGGDEGLLGYICFEQPAQETVQIRPASGPASCFLGRESKSLKKQKRRRKKQKKKVSSVKLGRNKDEGTLSESNNGYYYSRILNLEDEAGPSSPTPSNSSYGSKEQLKAAEVLVAISRPRGLSIPGPIQTQPQQPTQEPWKLQMMRRLLDKFKLMGCRRRKKRILKDGGEGIYKNGNGVEDVFSWLDEVSLVDGIFDGAFGGVRDEEVVVGEGVVRFSSSFMISTKSCFGGMMVSLILLKPWEEDA